MLLWLPLVIAMFQLVTVVLLVLVAVDNYKKGLKRPARLNLFSAGLFLACAAMQVDIYRMNMETARLNATPASPSAPNNGYHPTPLAPETKRGS